MEKCEGWKMELSWILGKGWEGIKPSWVWVGSINHCIRGHSGYPMYLGHMQGPIGDGTEGKRGWLCYLHLLFQGPVAKELSGLPSGPSAGSGPPPPPPGPPPPPVPTSSGSDESASRSALFAQINQGESITHGKWMLWQQELVNKLFWQELTS